MDLWCWTIDLDFEHWSAFVVLMKSRRSVIECVQQSEDIDRGHIPEHPHPLTGKSALGVSVPISVCGVQLHLFVMKCFSV